MHTGWSNILIILFSGNNIATRVSTCTQTNLQFIRDCKNIFIRDGNKTTFIRDGDNTTFISDDNKHINNVPVLSSAAAGDDPY